MKSRVSKFKVAPLSMFENDKTEKTDVKDPSPQHNIHKEISEFTTSNLQSKSDDTFSKDIQETKSISESKSKSKLKEPIKFLNKGTYGCIYKPDIQCNPFLQSSSEPKSKYAPDFISKIGNLDKDKSILRETAISAIIREIPNYKYYFAPFESSSCPLDLSQINEDEIQKCPFINEVNENHSKYENETTEKQGTETEEKDIEKSDGEKPVKIKFHGGVSSIHVGEPTSDIDDAIESQTYTPTPTSSQSSFISNNVRYIGDLSITQYLLTCPTPDIFVKRLLETYLHLLKSLASLQDAHIIHYDLKDNNIMYDIIYGVPIIIDFGLSFSQEQIQSSNSSGLFGLGQKSIPHYKDCFYAYFDNYPSWPIDIVLLSFLSKHIDETHDKPVNKQELLDIVQLFFQNNDVFTKLITQHTSKVGEPMLASLAGGNSHENENDNEIDLNQSNDATISAILRYGPVGSITSFVPLGQNVQNDSHITSIGGEQTSVKYPTNMEDRSDNTNDSVLTKDTQPDSLQIQSVLYDSVVNYIDTHIPSESTTNIMIVEQLISDTLYSWDNYALSVMFYTFLYSEKQMLESIENNELVHILDTFKQLLYDVITTFPNRPTAKDILITLQ